MRAGRYELPNNICVHSVGKEKGYNEFRRSMEFYRHLWGILRQGPIDCCFSHMNHIFSILAAPVLKAWGIPLVTWYAHPNLNISLKFAHFLSDRMVASLPSAYPYKHDKLTVIGQGIDTELFSPEPGMQRDKPPKILCVGRLSSAKDHPTLLKALALLRKAYGKPFKVDIVGSPLTPLDRAYQQSLQEMSLDLGLQDLVNFHGSVPYDQLPSWYRSSVVHVNLTPKGFGDKVALEAMACGCPCVCANTGFKTTLGVYSSDLIFNHGDPDDLCKKILALLLLDNKQRENIGLYLRNQIIMYHSLVNLSDNLIKILRDLQKHYNKSNIN